MGTDTATAPLASLVGVTLECRDPRALARFYGELLGWTDVVEESDGWVSIKEPSGSMHISCQGDEVYRPPIWPAEPDKQQMMLHLEIRVTDLEPACTRAERLGAVQLAWQPQPNVRVYADPEGHPFCLFAE